MRCNKNVLWGAATAPTVSVYVYSQSIRYSWLQIIRGEVAEDKLPTLEEYAKVSNKIACYAMEEVRMLMSS